MSVKVVIIDFGMGNIQSVRKKIDKLGARVIVSNDIKEILAADKVILPGVGHFERAMHNLRLLDLVDGLHEFVHIKKKPVLGICLGMQLMALHSEEGDSEGLGWLDANIVKFNMKNPYEVKVPQIGWNTVNITKKESSLLRGIYNDTAFYFVHAYYMKLHFAEDELCNSFYDVQYTSAVEHENIFGMQFHPEKSHEAGNIVLNNFVNHV